MNSTELDEAEMELEDSEVPVVDGISFEEDRKNLFLSFYNKCEELIFENQKAYDQALLTFSGGAIAALLAFFPTIKIPAPIFEISFFGLTSGLILITYQLSPIVLKWKQGVVNRYYIQGQMDAYKDTHRLTKVIMIFHITAGVCFAIGAISTVISISNIKPLAEEKMGKSTENSYGYSGPEITKTQPSPTKIKDGYTGPTPIPISSTTPPPSPKPKEKGK